MRSGPSPRRLPGRSRRPAALLVMGAAILLLASSCERARIATTTLRFLPTDPPLASLRTSWIRMGEVTLRALDGTGCHPIWPVARLAPTTAPAPMALEVTASVGEDRVVVEIEGPGEISSPDLLEVVLRSRDSAGTRTGSIRLYWREAGEPFSADRSLLEVHGEALARGLRSYRFSIGRESGQRSGLAALRLVLMPPLDTPIELCSILGAELAFDHRAFADAMRHGVKAELGGQIRNALPGWVSFPIERRVEVPPAGELRFGYGLEQGAAQTAELRVVVVTEGRSAERFRAVLDPQQAAGMWHDARVSLADLAGRSVLVRLETLSVPVTEPWLGLPWWAHPEVVANAARHPAATASSVPL